MIGRGRGFFYRSFYFLCLAAAVASSYGTNRIVQYENGVLATAVPPSPAYFMTRHAHPRVHQSAETLFSAVLGGRWKIDNPFLYRTKGETVNELLARLGDVRARKIIAETETCWYQYSNQLAANRGKPPGKPCGVCVPCIIRRAALDKSEGHYDLNRRKVRGDAVLARDFNAYQTLVALVKAPNGGARTFLEFPGYVKDLTKGVEPVFSRDELIALFHRFATEFENAFSLSRVR
jgi:Queuosine biosynthesis protein QueC